MSLNVRRTIADNDVHSLTVAAQAGTMAVDGEVVIDLAKRSVDVTMNTAGGKCLLCIFTYYMQPLHSSCLSFVWSSTKSICYLFSFFRYFSKHDSYQLHLTTPSRK